MSETNVQRTRYVGLYDSVLSRSKVAENIDSVTNQPGKDILCVDMRVGRPTLPSGKLYYGSMIRGK